MEEGGGSARREREKGHDPVKLDLGPGYELAARREREREERRGADDRVLAARRGGRGRGLEAERDAVNLICSSMDDQEVAAPVVGLERDLDGPPAQPLRRHQAVIGPSNGMVERDVESADELAARRERGEPWYTDHKGLAARREREAESDAVSVDSTGVLRGREEGCDDAPLDGSPPQPPLHNQAGIVDHAGQPFLASSLNPHAESFLPRVERNSADQPLVAAFLNPHANIFMPRARVERHSGDRQLPLGECRSNKNPPFLAHIPDGDDARQVFDPNPQPEFRFSAVWSHNWEVESNRLSNVLSQGRAAIVAFDLEYAAPTPVNNQRGRPRNATDWYDRLHSLVNSGDLVQVGLAVLFSEGENRLQILELNLLFDQSQQRL